MLKLWKLTDLSRFTLQANDGETGKVQEIYFDDKEWCVRYFVVKLDGLMSRNNVLIAPSMISDLDGNERTIAVDLTMDQLKNAPPTDTTQPVSRHYEEEYHHYYGLSPYWEGKPLTESIEKPKSDVITPRHPHLRSSDEVRKYGIRAQDGDIGHVVDFILESPTWLIRYLEVDTRNWLPGRHVLVSPIWLSKIDWSSQGVSVNLSRETIRTAPAYDPEKLNSKDYQVKLYAHYGKSLEQE